MPSNLSPVILVFFCVLFCFFTRIVNTQLLINVKNQGGDVVQETITANVSEDTVLLEFQRSDGTLITQLIDFRREVGVVKALVLGEEERGQSQYQVMCFICHVSKQEFISSDAISKLRQKNPGTLRSPEVDRGKEVIRMDMTVEVDKAAPISRHITSLCAEAWDATYTRRSDIDLWAALPGASLSELLGCAKEGGRGGKRCQETVGPWGGCQCRLELSIGWYPCGLKYCRGSTGSYRCGIKTCRKAYAFLYPVPHKQLCLWDESQ